MSKKFRSSLSQRAAEHQCSGGKKQRTWLLNRHPFERKSSSIKAKGRQSHRTGFARDFGSIVAGTKPSGRTLDLYIYIYIANGESPSQHVSVGSLRLAPITSVSSENKLAGSKRNTRKHQRQSTRKKASGHGYVPRRGATLDAESPRD